MLLLPTLALTLLPSAGPRSDVLVVNAGGGADYTDIQAAVDAAMDGDTLLVKGGSYGPFQIASKGLSVVAERGETVNVLGGVAVQNTQFDLPVVIAGLNVDGSDLVPGGRRNALEVFGTAGPVRIEDCTLRGANGIPYSANGRGGIAADVTLCLDVAFVRSTMVAGRGAMSLDASGTTNFGGDGLYAVASEVAVYDCALVGGEGGLGNSTGGEVGSWGGHGAYIVGVLFASGSSFMGGDGHDDDLGTVCFPGGHGLRLDGGAHADLLDVTLAGGSSGCGGPPVSGFDLISGSTIAPIADTARRIVVPNPVRENEVVLLELHGEPGDTALLLVSHTPGAQPLPALGGVLLAGLPLAQGRRLLGVIPGSGTLTKSVQIPALPSGVLASTWHLQSLMKNVAGTLRLGSHVSLVVFDEGL